jgi:hypothetical protein
LNPAFVLPTLGRAVETLAERSGYGGCHEVFQLVPALLRSLVAGVATTVRKQKPGPAVHSDLEARESGEDEGQPDGPRIGRDELERCRACLTAGIRDRLAV